MPGAAPLPWLLALAALLSGTACSAVSYGPPPKLPPPPHLPPGRFTDLLSRELAHVADTPGTRSHVVFGQVARTVRGNGDRLGADGVMTMRDGGRYTEGRGYGPLTLFGWSDLNVSAGDGTEDPVAKLRGALGFHPALATTALTAGDPAHQSTRLTGRFDARLIGAKLRALGARPDRGAWRLRTDGATDVTDPLGRRFPELMDQVDVVRAAPDEVAYGGTAGGVAAVRATSRTLTDDREVRAVAACLGDPLVAELTDDGLTPDRRPEPYLLGIGVRRGPGRPGSEVLCRTAATPAAAARAAAAMRRALAHGTTPGRKPIPTLDHPRARSLEAARYTELLRGVRVTVVRGGTVRVTARPGPWTTPTILDRLWSSRLLTPLDR